MAFDGVANAKNPTTTASVALFDAPTGNYHILVTKIVAQNVGSADVYVILKDGTTERRRHWLPIGATWSEMDKQEGIVPLSKTTAATAMNACLSAAGSVMIYATADSRYAV
jgi:hypothetical protein